MSFKTYRLFFLISSLFLCGCQSDHFTLGDAERLLAERGETIRERADAMLSQDYCVLMSRMDRPGPNIITRHLFASPVFYSIQAEWRGDRISFPLPDSLRDKDIWKDRVFELKGFSGKPVGLFIKEENIPVDFFLSTGRFLDQTKFYALVRPMGASHVEIRVTQHEGLIYFPSNSSDVEFQNIEFESHLVGPWHYFRAE